ncbi:MAG: FxLYD domain-containing protein [Tannerellaceae bacterium]|nr:FxLYD domain-containing protein [Tannerellaceae bacterium]MCD8263914.1 FxLYD domain-containing protein [Tannerellaceae bacterium]
MFRFGGIHRSVYLYAAPKVHVRDYFLRSDFEGDDFSSATFEVEASVRNYGKGNPGAVSIEVDLLDANGKTVTTLSRTIDRLSGGKETKVSLQTTVANPLLWSPKHPTSILPLSR